MWHRPLTTDELITKFAISLPPQHHILRPSQESTNVWVDHCEFSSALVSDKDFYDGLVDSSHGSDFITISQ